MPPLSPLTDTIASVTEIGSAVVRMRIVRLAPDGWSLIDTLEQPIRIGREVFTTRRIRFDSVGDLSRILEGYSRVMREYGVTRSRTVATTALREAENRDYVVDLIRIRNGISIEVLEEAEESALAFERILSRYPQAVGDGGTLLAYLGTGNVGLAFAQDGHILFSSSLPTGIQRLGDLLSGVSGQTSRFNDVLDEYVRAMLSHVRIPLEGFRISGVAISGRNLPAIAEMCGAVREDGLFAVGREALAGLYAASRARPAPDAAGDDLNLLPTLAVLTELLALTDASQALVPDFELSDVLIDLMGARDAKALQYESRRQNVLESARRMARAYRCDLSHADWVALCAVRIFDCLKKPHGMGTRARLLLEASAWLHDIGYYVNARNHRAITFEILRGATLFGLSDNDMFMVACIAGSDEYDPSVDRFRQMPFPRGKDRIIATKLAAVLQLANALDQSRTQRLKDPHAELSGSRLTVRCRSYSDAVLERWALRRWTPAFEDVYGVQPELVVESLLL